MRASVEPEAVDEVEAAAKEMFAAIEREQPPNIRYGSCRLADGVTFLVLRQVDEGTENPLPQLPEFQRFQQGLRSWADGPPDAGPADVVGSYRLF
ncbi:MAG TPA: hypothetical protein VF506_01830 [Streptosporangiaceae bacterium]